MDGTGRVVFFDAKRNFGFIEPDDASGDVSFVLMPGQEALAVGDNVAFDLYPAPMVTPSGKPALRVWKVVFTDPRVPAATEMITGTDDAVPA